YNGDCRVVRIIIRPPTAYQSLDVFNPFFSKEFKIKIVLCGRVLCNGAVCFYGRHTTGFLGVCALHFDWTAVIKCFFAETKIAFGLDGITFVFSIYTALSEVLCFTITSSKKSTYGWFSK